MNMHGAQQTVRLQISVYDVPALDMPSLSDPRGRSDPFVQIWSLPSQGGMKNLVYTSEVLSNKKTAKFDMTPPLPIVPGSAFQIDLYDSDTMTSNDPIGYTVIYAQELASFLPTISRPLIGVRVGEPGTIVAKLDYNSAGMNTVGMPQHQQIRYGGAYPMMMNEGGYPGQNQMQGMMQGIPQQHMMPGMTMPQYGGMPGQMGGAMGGYGGMPMHHMAHGGAGMGHNPMINQATGMMGQSANAGPYGAIGGMLHKMVTGHEAPMGGYLARPPYY